MLSWLTVLVVVVVLLLGFTVFFGAPYVPSRRHELRKLFDYAYKLGPDDTLIDLGSGDGAVLRVAREYGANVVGYELGPVYVWLSKLLARGDTKQRIVMANYWRIDLPEHTTVVYAFSDSRDIAKVANMMQSQANKMQKSFTFITLGANVPDKQAVKHYRAYHIYTFTPCVQGKA